MIFFFHSKFPFNFLLGDIMLAQGAIGVVKKRFTGQPPKSNPEDMPTKGRGHKAPEGTQL